MLLGPALYSGDTYQEGFINIVSNLNTSVIIISETGGLKSSFLRVLNVNQLPGNITIIKSATTDHFKMDDIFDNHNLVFAELLKKE